MSPSQIILGVDGGGTKTVAWLAPLDDIANTIVLGRGQAGSGNPRAAGFNAAQANIAAAIDAAFADAKLPRTAVAAACFGLAGAGREIEQQRISAWAVQQDISPRVHVTGDAEPILAAASPKNCGIALICGTGSLAWGRNMAGETARAGGWGYLLGDEGSGYTIARAGLTAAVRSHDARGQPTALLHAFQQELDAATPDDLVERVYSAEMSRERIAGLAPIVFAAADNDKVARSIIEASADELALMVAVLCSRLALFGPEFSLALAGSVLLNQECLRTLLLLQLETRNCRPQTVSLVEQPVRGAVSLARLSISPVSASGELR